MGHDKANTGSTAITGSLLDHDAEAFRLLDLMEEHEGDEDAQKAIWEEYLAAAERVGIKLDNTAAIIVDLRRRASAYAEEGVRWMNRAQPLKKKAERLEDFLRRYLIARDMKRVDGERFTLKLRTAGGKRAVEVPDLDVLPDELIVESVLRKPDKATIRQRLEDGEEIEGAYLAPRKVSLNIG